MRPGCENCDHDLPPDTPDAWICSFECTWCATCAVALDRVCPNCGGDLVRRPTRADHLLDAYPPSTTRVHKPAPSLS